MKSGRLACLILALILSPLGSLRTVAPSQEAQPSPQSVEVEIDPLPSVLTAMNIPARGVLCGLTGLMAGIVMAASAGMRYADAAKMMEDGCSGPWVITREMLEESRKKEMDETSSRPRPSEKPSPQAENFPPAALP